MSFFRFLCGKSSCCGRSTMGIGDPFNMMLTAYDDDDKVDFKYLMDFQKHSDIKFEDLKSNYDRFYRLMGQPFNQMTVKKFFKLIDNVTNTKWSTARVLDREIDVEKADL